MDLDENTLVWIDDPKPKLKALARIPNAPINFTWLDFGAHAGTHIDAPFYLFNDKWKSNEIPLELLNGDCQVLDLTEVDDMINLNHLKSKQIKSTRILLKTKNSYDDLKTYNPKHIALSEEAARYLVEKGVKLIGYDYQSFEREGKNVIHRIFMERDVICLDNLRLSQTEEKVYELILLPLKVIGIDAAPARAILKELKYEN